VSASRGGSLRQLAKGMAAFALIGAGSRLIGLLAVPVYLRLLSPGEFGLQAIVLLNEQVLMIIAGYAVTNAIARFYSDAKRRGDPASVIGTAVSAVLVSGVVLSVVLQVVAEPISRLTLDGSDEAVLATRLLGVSLPANLVVTLALSIWGLDVALRPFAVVTIGQYAVAAIIGVSLAATTSLGGAAPVAGWAIASLLAATFSLVWLRSIGHLAFRADVLRAMLRYGSPLVPAALIMMVLSANDRYLLEQIEGLESVGVYAAVLTVAFGVNTSIIVPFKRMWTAMMWRLHGEPGEPTFHRDALLAYAIVQGVLTGLLLTLGRPIMALLAGSDSLFVTAGPAIGIVYGGLALLGAADVLSAGVFFEGRTHRYTLAVTGATVVAVGFNLAVVPVWGLWAAAASNPVSYLVFAALSHRYGTMSFAVGHRWRRLFPVALLPVAGGALGALVGQDLPLTGVLLGIAGVGAALVTIRVTGLIGASELAAARRLVRAHE